MDETLKPVLERQMEIYAGFLEHTDFHVGRIIDTLETIGALENTLIYYIIGDNGASAEGTINGAFNEMANFNGMSAIETPEFMASVKDKLGTVDVLQPLLGGLGVGDVHAVPVDQAGRLALGRHPERHHRALARRDHRQAGVRSQFCHVIDVAPTILEAAGIPEPDFVNGVQQSPDRGHQHDLHASTTRTRRNGTICSTSRWPATAASTSRAGARSPGTAPRGCRTRYCPRWTTTCGNSTTATTTGPRPGTSPPNNPTGWRSCNGCG